MTRAHMFSSIECTGYTSCKVLIEKRGFLKAHIKRQVSCNLLNEPLQASKIKDYSLLPIEKEHGL